jgi:peptidyl-prolyl cis-trans isomerase C
MDAASGKSGYARMRLAIAFGCVALFLAACARQTGAQHPPEPGDTAVATVNGETVWASDVKREAVTQGLIGEGEPLDVSSPTFHQALDQLIDEKLLAVEAVRQNLANDPETKRRLAAARERILGDVLVENVVERTVSESSIRALYQDEVQSSGQAEEMHAAQIVTASQADAQVVRKALAGGAAFAAVAMQRSIDAQTRLNGGDLGYFTADVLPPTYADALKSAKVGDVVGPFRTDAGWVVVKLEDRKSETPISLDAARPEIVNFLTYEQVRDLLKRLRHDSQIKLLIGPAAPSPITQPEPASAPSSAAPVASSTPATAASSGPIAVSSAAAAPTAAPRPPHPRVRHAPPASAEAASSQPASSSSASAPVNETQ